MIPGFSHNWTYFIKGTTTRKFMTSIIWSIVHEDTWLDNSWPQKEALKNCPTELDTLLCQLQSTISISPNYSQLILLASLIHFKLQYLQAKSKYCPLMELPFSEQPFHSIKKRIIHSFCHDGSLSGFFFCYWNIWHQKPNSTLFA